MEGGGDGSAAGDGGGFDHGGHDHGSHGHNHSFHSADGGSMDFQELTEAADLSAQVDHNPFKSVKLSDVFKGITVTPNFMLAMMFVGFTAWLFVVYWIRHNEPLANQVLGTPTQGAPLAHHDRAIVAGARNALPFLPKPSTQFYTPDKKLREATEPNHSAGLPPLPSLGDPTAFSQQSAAALNYSMPPHLAGSAISAPQYWGPDQEMRVLKGGRDHTVIPHPEPMQAPAMMPVPQFSQQQYQPSMPLAQQTYGAAMPQQAMPPQQQLAPQPMPYGGSYNIGGHVYHPSQGGTRLKMVVNR